MIAHDTVAHIKENLCVILIGQVRVEADDVVKRHVRCLQDRSEAVEYNECLSFYRLRG